MSCRVLMILSGELLVGNKLSVPSWTIFQILALGTEEIRASSCGWIFGFSGRDLAGKWSSDVSSRRFGYPGLR